MEDGLYRSAEKFVRTKSGTITDVKYKITRVPSGNLKGSLSHEVEIGVDHWETFKVAEKKAVIEQKDKGDKPLLENSAGKNHKGRCDTKEEVSKWVNIAPEYMRGVYKKWNELVNSNKGETLKKSFALMEKS